MQVRQAAPAVADDPKVVCSMADFVTQIIAQDWIKLAFMLQQFSK